MSAKVERFRAGEYVEIPISDPQGKWVRYSDYEKLETRLAQVEKERSDLQERLAAEIANRVNVNVTKMEESQKTTQAELERQFVDDRPTDTCRGSYEG